MDGLEAFVRALPKAELHLHVEGTLEPELMLALARRNRLAPPFPTVEAARDAYAFDDLQAFLDIYYAGAAVLLTEEDFHDLALAYLTRAAADGVRRVEMFFDPQTHTARGVPFAVVIKGLLAAAAEAERRLGVSVGLIMSFLRHLSEDEAFETLREAEPWLDRLLGAGLDSSETGHPPAKFQRVFRACGERGLRLTAHAGEEGPPAYVREALDLLHVERIDHGNRSLEDAALTRRLAAEGIVLTVCPLSNLRLKLVDDLGAHPLATMLARGLKATVNSDDPAYFGGYVVDNYVQTARALGLSRADLVGLARNSLEGAFLTPEAARPHLQALDDYAGAPPNA
jgi:adenosine deaminase